MPKVNLVIEQKRPLDATPERALSMCREGHLKQTEIAKLWGISKSRVSVLIKKALKAEAKSKALQLQAKAQRQAAENEFSPDSLND